MFLQKRIFKRLMTEAYKHRLIVAMTEDEWLYMAGSYWEVNIKKEYIPKETMGDIIALIGELPEPGERFSSTKEGNQMEFDGARQIDIDPFRRNEPLVITDVFLMGTGGTLLRLLQDADTGQVFAVNNVFIDIINNAECMKEKGEYLIDEPFYNVNAGILWKNNVCMLRAGFRRDQKNEKVMNLMQGLDIIPIGKENTDEE